MAGVGKLAKQLVAPDLGEGITPLEYMLSVVRDPTIDPARRDRMAVAAAPYCHPRVAEYRLGKKDLKEKAAKQAAIEWGDDLVQPAHAN